MRILKIVNDYMAPFWVGWFANARLAKYLSGIQPDESVLQTTWAVVVSAGIIWGIMLLATSMKNRGRY